MCQGFFNWHNYLYTQRLNYTRYGRQGNIKKHKISAKMRKTHILAEIFCLGKCVEIRKTPESEWINHLSEKNLF